MRILFVLAAIALAGLSTSAQTCPSHSGLDGAPQASVLHGTLRYHNDLREWLGLKPDRPVCGEVEIQFIFSGSGAWRVAESLRGCSVTATGRIFESPTTYYSADLAVQDPEL